MERRKGLNNMNKWDTKTLIEFANRIKAHYPHTQSIQNTIDKELVKMLEEVNYDTDNH